MIINFLVTAVVSIYAPTEPLDESAKNARKVRPGKSRFPIFTYFSDA